MRPMYPAVGASSQGLNPGNDSRHNKLEPTNRSGGPSLRTRKKVPVANRGGFSHQGQRRQADADNSHTGRSRGPSSNPAGRGGTPKNFTPHQKIAGHGGSPQEGRGNVALKKRGGFSQSGKTGVPNQYANANPQMKTGNTGGRMHRRIAGRFNNKSKGGNSGGLTGSFGSMPVTEDTV